MKFTYEATVKIKVVENITEEDLMEDGLTPEVLNEKHDEAKRSLDDDLKELIEIEVGNTAEKIIEIESTLTME